MSAVAPDYAGPLEGWRVWRVARAGDDRDFRLLSLAQEVVWPTRDELVASCRRCRLLPRLRRRNEHSAPTEACSCGIYATDLDRLDWFLDERTWPTPPYVFGRVLLWGRVIECERGWRAARAYPREIFVAAPPYRLRDDATPERIARGLGEYGVPVHALPVAPHAALGAVAEHR